MDLVGRFVADAAPRLAPDILITIDDGPVLTLHWRRLATRESPRTAAGPIHSCADHRCAGCGPQKPLRVEICMTPGADSGFFLR